MSYCVALHVGFEFLDCAVGRETKTEYGELDSKNRIRRQQTQQQKRGRNFREMRAVQLLFLPLGTILFDPREAAFLVLIVVVVAAGGVLVDVHGCDYYILIRHDYYYYLY